MEYVIAGFAIYLLAFWLGYFVREKKLKRAASGVLRVDRSDPDGPYLFLELSRDVNAVMRDKYITLEVDTKGYISRD